MPAAAQDQLRIPDGLLVARDDDASWGCLKRSLPGAAVATTTSLLAALWPDSHHILDWRVLAAAGLDQFTDRYNALLAEQEAGICAFYVLVAEDGSVLGRFNLVDIEDHTAELGYRVAQHVAGRGVATATVRALCRLAAAQHGLRTPRAATVRQNAASQKVLTKAGFIPVGPAHLGGKPGTWYQRDLAL